MRYKLTMTYDGSSFHGFQRQLKYSSVQETIEKALSEIFKDKITIHASGRTDAGVHALAQVAHFDSDIIIPTGNLKKVLNKKIYPFIYIKEIAYVDNTFHARKSAIKKEYHYFVNIGQFDPLKARYMHFFHNHIDLSKIKEAMKYLIGEHDFTSFSKHHEKQNTIRCIESFDLVEHDDILEFIIIGNGFLHNMVRIIIALMLKVGEGKFEPDYVKAVIDGKNRSLAPYVAPATGLYLWKVYYE